MGNGGEKKMGHRLAVGPSRLSLDLIESHFKLSTSSLTSNKVALVSRLGLYSNPTQPVYPVFSMACRTF